MAFALGLVGCGGGIAASATSAANDDAGAPDRDGGASDASSTPEASVAAADSGVEPACRFVLASSPATSFASPAARVERAGTEIPFLHFACGDADAGDPYALSLELTAYPDAAASVTLVDARSAAPLAFDACAAVTLLRDGVAIAPSAMFDGRGGLVRVRAEGCTASEPSPSAGVSWVTIEADLVAAPH